MIMTPQMEIQIIAVIVAISCSLVGSFLVLTKKTMMSDAITHTILLGIVLAFFVTHDLSSPLLIIGASTMGLATVWATEALSQSKLVSEDASIGVIFPLIFSIAIILISRYAGSVHLDTDSVLLGELAFAPFERMKVGGIDIGAKGIYSTGIVLVVNIVALMLLLKELKISIFDPILSALMGFSPTVIHYGLMSLVSVTAVSSFQAVGSILVVAFMVGPPVTAYLLTDDLKKMLGLSTAFAAGNAILGYQLASHLDVSIAGCMAVMTGITFFVIVVIGKERGLITVFRRRKKQRLEFENFALLFHLLQHEGQFNESVESAYSTMKEHMNWKEELTYQTIHRLEKEQSLEIEEDKIRLTPLGRSKAKKEFEELFGEF